MNFLKFRASIFGCLSAVICLSIFLTSCEKTEDVVKMQTEEDNINITDNDSKISIDDNIEVLEPVLHMRISDDLTEEEANAQWDAKVNKYIAQQELEEPQLTERGVTTKLYSFVDIRTAKNDRAGTYGRVAIKLKFDTSFGSVNSGWIELDHKNYTDRKKGATDRYLISTPIREPRWAGLVSAELRLKGTDDWFFDKIKIDAIASSSHSTGLTSILFDKTIALWNSKDYAVDFYRTHKSYAKGFIFWTI